MVNTIVFHHSLKDYEGELQKAVHDIKLEETSIRDLNVDSLINTLREKFNEGLAELSIVLKERQKE